MAEDDPNVIVGALQVDPRDRITTSSKRSLKTAQEEGTRILRETANLPAKLDRKCKGHVRLRPDMSRAAAPDNEYFRNPDGSVMTRPCKKRPIKGGLVCATHGGSIKSVRNRANKRLLAMVEPSLIRLNELMHQDEHLPTALGAIRTTLERAGSNAPIGPLAKDVGEKNTRPIINIGIKVGGIDQPKVTVAMLPPKAGDDDATEGDLIDGDNEADE